MPLPNWLNENANRDWPFITRVEPVSQYAGSTPDLTPPDGAMTHLPESAIVDFGAIMEIDAKYDESEGHIVYLYSVERLDTDTFMFDFRTTAPSADNYAITLTRSTTDAENIPEWREASSLSGDPADDLACEVNPRWRAFIVTGNLTPLTTLLNISESIVFATGLWQVEPSRIQSLHKSYLRACNLLNFPRTLATAPEGCVIDYSSSAQLGDEPLLHTSCVSGDILFEEGYNCSIRQDNHNNSIVIAAVAGTGAGQPCEEIPIYAGEAPPVGSPYLSGGPSCDDILKSLNGVGARNLQIVPGPGFRIAASIEDPNTLVIDRSMNDFIICDTGSSLGLEEDE